jgi:predicted porin
MRNLKAPIIVGGVILSVLSASAQAEITVLDKNKQSDSLLAPLSLQVGGSIRPEWIFQNTKNKTHGDSSGHDGGTRFRFSGDYALTDHTSIIGKYELGVNMYHLLNIKSGYDESSNLLKKRQLYYGFKDDRYGTLTYGKQYGPTMTSSVARVTYGITMVRQRAKAWVCPATSTAVTVHTTASNT